jgi:hypothetical protein
VLSGFVIDTSPFPCAVYFVPLSWEEQHDLNKIKPRFHEEKITCVGQYGPAPLLDKKKKYPILTSQYESINVPGLYFGGTLMHTRDFRKSSGGFLHGFRYTLRSLFHILQETNHGIPWPHLLMPSLDAAAAKFMSRINVASGLYQMFGLNADVLMMHESGARIELRYYEDYPLDRLLRLPDIVHATRILALTFEYHPDFHGAKVFDVNRAENNPRFAHNSNFLHPVFRLWRPVQDAALLKYFYADTANMLSSNPNLSKEPLERFPFQYVGWNKVAEHHMVEDFLVNFDVPIIHSEPFLWWFLDVFRASSPASETATVSSTTARDHVEL